MPLDLDPSDYATYSGRPEPSQADIARWEASRQTISQILPNLYMGGVPETYVDWVVQNRIVYLVDCTQSGQSAVFDSVPYSPIRHRLPMRDGDELPPEKKLRNAARAVASFVRAGEPVYVHCAFGLNRSGLVMAYVLNELLGWEGPRLLAAIRQRRPGSLFNPRFVQAVLSIARKEVEHESSEDRRIRAREARRARAKDASAGVPDLSQLDRVDRTPANSLSVTVSSNSSNIQNAGWTYRSGPGWSTGTVTNAGSSVGSISSFSSSAVQAVEQFRNAQNAIALSGSQASASIAEAVRKLATAIPASAQNVFFKLKDTDV